MSTRIELGELETYLYASADILRGHVEASDYKSFVFPLLFFKRICDVYDEETQKAEMAKFVDGLSAYNRKQIMIRKRVSNKLVYYNV